MPPARFAHGVAALAFLVAAAVPSRLAAQEEGPPPPPPPPIVQVYATAGLSLLQTAFRTTFADVLAVGARIGVPLRYGLEPWAAAELSRLHVACDPGAADCSRTERRLLAGMLYHPGVGAGPGGGEDEGGGAYLGGGLGTETFRGKSMLAHTIILGLPLGRGRRFAPVLELRVDGHQRIPDVLLIAGGLRLGAGR